MAKTIHLHIHGRARVSTSDSGDWDESKHKRDKGGQFSSTGGGGGASKAAPAKSSAPSKEPASAPAATEADIRKKYAHLSPEQLSSTRGANKTEQRVINKMAVENVKPAANAVPGQRGLPPAAVGWQGKPMTATQSVTAPGGAASTRSSVPEAEKTFQSGRAEGFAKMEQRKAIEDLKSRDFELIGSHNGRDFFKHPKTGEVRSVGVKVKAPNPVERHAGKSGTATMSHRHHPEGVPPLIVAAWEKDGGASANASGQEQARAQAEANEKAMPKNSHVNVPGGGTALVLAHRGNMVLTNKGEFHATKLTPVAKGVSQARVDTTKGNHKPGWMLRADPELAAKFKAAEARLAERKAIK